MEDKKILVLDTNILLENGCAYKEFEDNYVVVPSIVRGELDKFKKRGDDIGYHSRRFLSDTERMTRNGATLVGQNGGAVVNGGGLLWETYSYDIDGRDPLRYIANIGENDLQIIRSACVLQHHNPNIRVELVSHDKNVLTVARQNGITARSRTRGEVKVDQIPKGLEVVVNAEIVGHIFSNRDNAKKGHLDHDFIIDDVFLREHGIDLTTYPVNQYFLFKSSDQDEKFNYQQLMRFDIKEGVLRALTINPYRPIAGVVPHNIEQVQLMDSIMTPEISVVVGYGRAGTGKTLCMLAAALESVHQLRLSGDPDSVCYITKPVSMVGQEEYGFLPGDLREKVIQNYAGISKNYRKIMNWWRRVDEHKSGESTVTSESMRDSYGRNIYKALEHGIIKINPLGYIRGDTIMENERLIIDEAQNTIPPVMKGIVTRGETGSKTVISGDITQIDNPLCRPEYNGLSHIVDAIRRNTNPRYAFTAAIELTKSERGPQAEWGDKFL